MDDGLAIIRVSVSTEVLEAMRRQVEAFREQAGAFASWWRAADRALGDAARAAGVRPVRSVRWLTTMLDRAVGEKLPRDVPLLRFAAFVRQALARRARRILAAARALALLCVPPPLPEPPADRPEPRDAGPAPPTVLVSALLLAPSAPPASPGASR